jgi:hypothetical protein
MGDIVWETACGREYCQFEDYTLEELETFYCHGCGGKIEQRKEGRDE